MTLARGGFRGRIKVTPEDFVVDEIPAYEPSGEGTHLYLHLHKRNMTTDAAVRAVTRALEIPMRDVGVAGMKDKVAVTTQWISVPVPAKQPDIERRATELALDGVRVLAARRHGNKLKTGHLKGNRFTIVVRGIPVGDVAAAKEMLARIGREGVPNAFGQQRFGREGDNAERARGWLTGKDRAPGDPRLRRLLFSSLQSAIFNAVLEARVADGTWTTPLLGDVLRKEDTGGLFLCSDVQADGERATRGEVSPTGPIVGVKMRSPEGEVKALEDRLAAPLLEGVDLARAKQLGEGTRRALRLFVAELTVDEAPPTSVGQVIESTSVEPAMATPEETEQGAALQVRFVLPKGAYATTVLANAFDLEDSRATNAESSSTEDGAASIEGAGAETETEAQ